MMKGEKGDEFNRSTLERGMNKRSRDPKEVLIIVVTRRNNPFFRRWRLLTQSADFKLLLLESKVTAGLGQ